MKVFHLKFNKEADGHWYIDLPHYPFAHHNLMLVAGADNLCQYGAEKEGHPDYALIDVTLGENLIDGKDPDIIMTRIELGHGATYTNTMASGETPMVWKNGREILVSRAWLCPVTLLVLHCYPQRINLYLKDN